MSGRTALVIAVVGVAVAGCGTSPTQAVRDKVQQFAQAARRHDYRMICSEVLAPALVAHLTANQISCEHAMEIGLGGVQDPTVSIGKVTVTGGSASVVALTVARDQQGAIDTFELTHTSDGWRISSLTAM